MKSRFPLFQFIVVCLCLFSLTSLAAAQETEKFSEASVPASRPNLLQRLSLTNEQIRRIRVLNRQRKPVLQAAQQRLRRANQALDQAVYADTENEAEIERLTQEVHAAQRDVLRLRVEIERAIRGLLTPEQLARFRNLRAEFQAGRAINSPARRNLKNARKPALRRVNR